MMNDEYIEIIEPLRLKYNMTGKEGITLLNASILKGGEISYKVFNKLSVKVVFRKHCTRLLVKSALLKLNSIDLGLKSPYEMKSSPDMPAIDFDTEEDVLTYIVSFLELAIITYEAPKEFVCCSRYKECSERKECVNPNKIRAKQCYYRDNIENGIIYF